MTLRSLAVILGGLLLGGCVTGRRTFELPVMATGIPAVTHGRVYISSVTDHRHFENDPSDPSIPSVSGDFTKLSGAQRDHMIGRQRDTFGKAMGDVSLPANDTVTQRVRLLIAQGLARSGYQVTSDPQARNRIVVSIRKFWGWMTPGFFALTFEANIECVITATGGSVPHTIVVRGYGRNHGQVAKDENWLEAFEPAFDDFESNLAAQSQDLQLRPNASESAQGNSSH